MIITLFSSLYENKPVHFSEEEWAEVLRRTVQYDLAPQLYHQIQQRHRTDIPTNIIKELKMKAASVMIQNAWMKAETERLVSSLAKNGIQVIVLKGTKFAEQYFGHYGARRTGDIDLLVPDDQIGEAEACLLTSGYRMTDSYHSLHYHVEYAKWIPDMNIPLKVELHRSLLRRHRSRMDLRQLWEEAEPVSSGSTVKQFTLQQTLYTICLHSSKHGMMRYRHILDVAHLIYQFGGQIDYGRLFFRARQDGTFGLVSGAMTITYRLFPGLNSIQPILDLARRIPWHSERIVLDTEQGHKGLRYYFHLLMYPLFTFDGLKPVWMHLRFILFPPRDQIERMLQTVTRMPAPVLYAKLYARRFGIWLKHRNSRARQ